MVDGQVMNKVQMVMTMQMLAQALPGYMPAVVWRTFFQVFRVSVCARAVFLSSVDFVALPQLSSKLSQKLANKTKNNQNDML